MHQQRRIITILLLFASCLFAVLFLLPIYLQLGNRKRAVRGRPAAPSDRRHGTCCDDLGEDGSAHRAGRERRNHCEPAETELWESHRTLAPEKPDSARQPSP